MGGGDRGGVAPSFREVRWFIYRIGCLRSPLSFEHFHQTCGAERGVYAGTVFLTLGIVSAQLQGFSNLRLRQSLAQVQKSSSPNATSFLSMLRPSPRAPLAGRGNQRRWAVA